MSLEIFCNFKIEMQYLQILDSWSLLLRTICNILKDHNWSENRNLGNTTFVWQYDNLLQSVASP